MGFRSRSSWTPRCCSSKPIAEVVVVVSSMLVAQVVVLALMAPLDPAPTELSTASAVAMVAYGSTPTINKKTTPLVF
ncbi:unnamed protein product [Linum trigynum]|uniref:Uncharacterized protein n=1 Tax=Linum trigynum TaxID=586398 RepID=A0AAV2F5G7_9ROSI